MNERDELIPRDLAPRITQMVVDDLRSAGWTVTPPGIRTSYGRQPGDEDIPPVPPSTAIRDRIRQYDPGREMAKHDLEQMMYPPRVRPLGDFAEALGAGGADAFAGCDHAWGDAGNGWVRCEKCRYYTRDFMVEPRPDTQSCRHPRATPSDDGLLYCYDCGEYVRPEPMRLSDDVP